MKKILCALSVAATFSGEAFAEVKCPEGTKMTSAIENAIRANEQDILKSINKDLGTSFNMISIMPGLDLKVDKEHGNCDYKAAQPGETIVTLLD